MPITQYFSSEYLFTSPIALQRSDWAMIWLAAVLVVAAIVLAVVRRRMQNPLKKNLLSRWVSLTTTIGILGLLWSGVRYEAIQMLSAHIVAMAIYLIGLVWAVYILKYTFGRYNEQYSEYQQMQLRNKYL